jgi:hypothetical protein
MHTTTYIVTNINDLTGYTSQLKQANFLQRILPTWLGGCAPEMPAEKTLAALAALSKLHPNVKIIVTSNLTTAKSLQEEMLQTVEVNSNVQMLKYSEIEGKKSEALAKYFSEQCPLQDGDSVFFSTSEKGSLAQKQLDVVQKYFSGISTDVLDMDGGSLLEAINDISQKMLVEDAGSIEPVIEPVVEATVEVEQPSTPEVVEVKGADLDASGEPAVEAAAEVEVKDAPQADAPEAEQDVTEEVVVVEAPASEAVAEAPTAEVVVSEAPTDKAPVAEQVVVEAVVEVKDTDLNASDEPAVEAAAEVEVKDAPQADAPEAEQDVAEFEAPVTEQVVIEVAEPVVEAPTAEVVVSEAPTDKAPASEQDVAEFEVSETPTDKASVAEPVVEASVAEPVVEDLMFTSSQEEVAVDAA